MVLGTRNLGQVCTYMYHVPHTHDMCVQVYHMYNVVRGTVLVLRSIVRFQSGIFGLYDSKN